MLAVVAGLAGRRVDPAEAEVPRFPPSRTEAVGAAIDELLRTEQVELLVASAACGADLLGLEAAMQLGIHCRVVLPYGAAIFRKTSVIDRPGTWGPLFDSIIEHVRKSGDLIELDEPSGDPRSYGAANKRIVSEVLGQQAALSLAIAVWEGEPRGQHDATADFIELAKESGLHLRTVSTCS